jgi:hypothetical protein
MLPEPKHYALLSLIAVVMISGDVDADETDKNEPSKTNSAQRELTEEERKLVDQALASQDEVIRIEGEEPYVPVASRSVRDRDFLLRAHPRPADILRVVPGMFVNQHAGGGKANQYFLRGFDADHGTDVSLSVDGVRSTWSATGMARVTRTSTG